MLSYQSHTTEILILRFKSESRAKWLRTLVMTYDSLFCHLYLTPGVSHYINHVGEASISFSRDVFIVE